MSYDQLQILFWDMKVGFFGTWLTLGLWNAAIVYFLARIVQALEKKEKTCK